MLFTRGLRRGLMQKIGELATQLAESRLATGLFPRLERAIVDVRCQRERLEGLALTAHEIRREIASTTAFGAPITAEYGQRRPVVQVPGNLPIS